ncbi:LacI family DNA-binding transcriptional regulator [Brevibacillus humidisoli]|uniref:LacI family DNA-binding transcriptional regulator n=1 Tax=Brevibacillus humidisoli TaxID=2895522 RepID=UPI001E651745|nr:LacI family DNA-binding transcriptional regulator [Brevibacillus humidisoli]UFJ39609.1 LacI family DNA-binding transcriptional regulator [Brevibacillus humidisoli]
MANIRQIAALAGVSVTTVSRVLNNHPYVSKEKREAVQKAVQQLNYVRNSNAVHLKKGKTLTIGVILPYLNNPYLNAPVEGIVSEALRSGYRVTLCQTDYRPEQESDALDMLKTKEVDGIVICSRSNSWEQLVPYTQYGPIVVCEDSGKWAISSVYIDHYRSFLLGMNHLISKGHRRIGYCIGRKNSHTSQARRQAYYDVLAAWEEPVPVSEEWLFYEHLSIEAGIEAARKLCKLQVRPTAMMMASHQSAAGMVTELRKQGIRVPEDLAVIGFDTDPIAQILDITAVEHPSMEVGRIAFNLLYQHIHERTYVPQKCEVPFCLVERSTV